MVPFHLCCRLINVFHLVCQQKNSSTINFYNFKHGQIAIHVTRLYSLGENMFNIQLLRVFEFNPITIDYRHKCKHLGFPRWIKLMSFNDNVYNLMVSTHCGMHTICGMDSISSFQPQSLLGKFYRANKPVL